MKDKKSIPTTAKSFDFIQRSKIINSSVTLGEIRNELEEFLPSDSRREDAIVVWPSFFGHLSDQSSEDYDTQPLAELIAHQSIDQMTLGQLITTLKDKGLDDVPASVRLQKGTFVLKVPKRK
jgi:hypothetical protein